MQPSNWDQLVDFLESHGWEHSIMMADPPANRATLTIICPKGQVFKHTGGDTLISQFIPKVGARERMAATTLRQLREGTTAIQ